MAGIPSFPSFPSTVAAGPAGPTARAYHTRGRQVNLNRPIGMVRLDGGPIVEVGPTPAVDTDFAFSPDATR